MTFSPAGSIASAACFVALATGCGASSDEPRRTADGAAPSANDTTEALDDAPLASGDTLALAGGVYPELTDGEYPVDAEGTIALPGLGRVPVAGLTLEQVSALVTGKYPVPEELADGAGVAALTVTLRARAPRTPENLAVESAPHSPEEPALEPALEPLR